MLHAGRARQRRQHELQTLPGARAQRPGRAVHQEHPQVTPRRRGVAVLPALLLSLALGACRVDEAAFEATIFSCNTTDPGCGKTAEGREMTCFQASQLDGTNFCAPRCDMA